MTERAGCRLLIASTVEPAIRAFLRPYAEHFRARGWEVDAMAAGASSSRTCQLAFDRVWDAGWSRRPFAPGNLLGAARQVRRIVAERGYDLVHVHTPVAGFITRYALRAKPHGVKVVYTAHGFHFHERSRPLDRFLFRSLERLAGRWTDALVVINGEDRQAALDARLVPASRLVHMPGIGVDAEWYHPGKVSPPEVDRLRQSLGLPASALLFSMLAEFIPRKRHADVLHALARVDRADVVVAFAGDGPLRHRVEALASEVGVAKRVRFVGFSDDVRPLLRASLAMILPSDQEGLPRSVMEAMALEIPVIGSRIRGTRELVTADRGVLVEVGDVEGLARAMTWTIDHPAERCAMARSARCAMASYDVRRVIALHEQLYASLMRR
jgi:glycosyltransferase involved in cell wall biosynthesis